MLTPRVKEREVEGAQVQSRAWYCLLLYFYTRSIWDVMNDELFLLYQIWGESFKVAEGLLSKGRKRGAPPLSWLSGGGGELGTAIL